MKLLKRMVRNRIVRIIEGEARGILSNRYVAGKLFPLDPTGPYHLLPKPLLNHGKDNDAEFRVPPKSFWEGYGQTQQEYLASGQRHMEAMVEILAKSGVKAENLQRVLDFGCASGRLLRFYPRERSGAEWWGVDINAQYLL